MSQNTIKFNPTWYKKKSYKGLAVCSTPLKYNIFSAFIQILLLMFYCAKEEILCKCISPIVGSKFKSRGGSLNATPVITRVTEYSVYSEFNTHTVLLLLLNVPTTAAHLQE